MTGSLALRDFFVANALWELALAAIRTFVILWLTRGLGIGLSSAALVVGAAAVLVPAGAAVSGRLADRHGARRVMTVAVAIFGAGLLAPLAFASAGPILPADVGRRGGRPARLDPLPAPGPLTGGPQRPTTSHTSAPGGPCTR